MSGPDHINPPLPEVETHTVMRMLETEIDSEELIIMGRELAGNVEKRDLIEVEYKGVRADYRKRLKDASGVINNLAHKIDTGTEDLEVECTITKDYEHNTFKCIRLDTGEVVEERALTAEELQRSMVDERPDDNVIDGDFTGGDESTEDVPY